MNNNYEKIIISDQAQSKEYQGQSLKGKHIVIEGSDFKTELEKLENCIVEGGLIHCQSTYNCKFLGTEKLLAEKLEFSVFENCNKIQVGNRDFNNKVYTSQFFNCNTISITDSDQDVPDTY